MTRQDIFEVLKANIIAVGEVPADRTIAEEDSMIADLRLDSLQAIEVVSRTMKQLNVRVSRAELAKAHNIQAVLDLMQTAVNAKESST